jgi:hypothetical protein
MWFDPLEHLQLLAGIVGFCAYIPLTVGILRNKVRQSFAAFFLWGLLDSIAMISAILVQGNFWLAASNVAGAFTIAALLLLKKQYEWSRTETLTCVMVAACLVIWYNAGHTVALVASSVAVVIAGIPQMAHTRRSPRDTPVGVYGIWMVANVLSLVAGKHWTIDERFYAACGIVLCLSILCITWIAMFQQKPVDPDGVVHNGRS